MARPSALPKGTIYYYDESQPPVPWMAGLREVRAWEDHTGKSMDQLGSTEDMLFLAYMSAKRDGYLPESAPESGSACIPFDEWKDTVLWLFDDDKAPGAGELSAPTA